VSNVNAQDEASEEWQAEDDEETVEADPAHLLNEELDVSNKFYRAWESQHAKQIFDSPVQLSQQIFQKLTWLRDHLERWNGSFIKRPTQIEVINTDASEYAGSAIWREYTMQQVWDQYSEPSLFDPVRAAGKTDIMFLELLSQYIALKAWGHLLHGKYLRFLGDS
jgi:hypothetical protein